ncbi:MAG: glycosyltransferase family 39 protein [Planctomycetales bacterium]|nr:glycosyltransferase family 39 protein [Planctomycetales bacterium]
MLPRIGFSVLVVLLVTKVIGVIMRGPSPMVLDAGFYWELGGSVADGDWLLIQQPVAYRTPAYPWLIGLFRTVFADPLYALVCFQGSLWIATIGLTTAIAIDIFRDSRIAWIIVGVAAVMISSVTYVSTVLTETLFVFLLMLHLWSVIRFTRQPSVLLGFAVGMTLGLAILTRPVAMLLWIADAIYMIISWYWIRDPSSTHLCLRRAKICAAMAVVVTVLCISPWLARNHALFGKVMMTEFVGRNVWIVTFQDGSGAGLNLPDSESTEGLRRQIGDVAWDVLRADDSWRDTWTVSRALTGSGMDDASADRLMKQIAADAIKGAPITFGKKTLRRCVNFWRTPATELPSQVADLDPVTLESGDLFAGQPTWGVKVAPVDTFLRYRCSNWLAGNTLLMMLAAASTMLMLWRRRTRAVGLLLAAILVYFSTVTAVLEIPAYRYRMIVEPIVLLVIALAIAPSLFLTAEPVPAEPVRSEPVRSEPVPNEPTRATQPE